MVVGIIVILIYIFLYKGWLFILGINFFIDVDLLLGMIKFMFFGVVGVLVNFVVVYFVFKVFGLILVEIE